MGQAKRRGTYEERKAVAVGRKKQARQHDGQVTAGLSPYPTKSASVAAMIAMLSMLNNGYRNPPTNNNTFR